MVNVLFYILDNKCIIISFKFVVINSSSSEHVIINLVKINDNVLSFSVKKYDQAFLTILLHFKTHSTKKTEANYIFLKYLSTQFFAVKFRLLRYLQKWFLV